MAELDTEGALMEPWQIDSALLAAHNVAKQMGNIYKALAFIAVALVLYPWLGGFGSSTKKENQ